MVRTEIYANHSVEDEILESVEKLIPGVAFSLLPDIHGRGRSGERRGDSIWPESNVLYLFYGTEEEAALISKAVAEVKKSFPHEGIKIIQYVVSRFALSCTASALCDPADKEQI